MEVTRLDPYIKIPGLNSTSIGDFWSWAYSDILNNRNRAVFAEFVVGSILGVTDKPRIEWDAVDLIFQGVKIEVKCSAYIQSWPQAALSQIKYDICKKRSWIAESNTWEKESTRSADLYVFCLYPETDKALANIIDIPSWQFFVVSTEEINEECGNQKTIGLKKLRTFCKPVDYSRLKHKIASIINESTKD